MIINNHTITWIAIPLKAIDSREIKKKVHAQNPQLLFFVFVVFYFLNSPFFLMFEQSTILQPFSNAKIFHLSLGNHVQMSCLQVCVRLTSYVTIYALLK